MSAIDMDSFEGVRLLRDAEVVARLQRLVDEGRKVDVRLLVQLSEVDARGLFRGAGYSSPHAYCVGALRMSADEAYFRICAARLVRRFPAVLEMYRRKELHLSAIKMLSPVLTEENHDALLAQARYKTKRDLELVLARYAPKPDVADSMRRLPAYNAPATLPSPYQTLALAQAGLGGEVSDLKHAERSAAQEDLAESNPPANETSDRAATEFSLPGGPGGRGSGANSQDKRASCGEHDALPIDLGLELNDATNDQTSRTWRWTTSIDPRVVNSAHSTQTACDSRIPLPSLPGDAESARSAQTACDSRIPLLNDPGDAEPARSAQTAGDSRIPLPSVPGDAVDPGDAESARSAQTACGSRIPLPINPGDAESAHSTRNQTAGASSKALPISSGLADRDAIKQESHEARRVLLRHMNTRASSRPLSAERFHVQFTADSSLHLKLRQAIELASSRTRRAGLAAVIDEALALFIAKRKRERFGVGSKGVRSTGRALQRSRYIPRAVRAAVFAREEARCAFVSSEGKRCSERCGLEYDHRNKPFARGGDATVGNLRLLCRAHNQLCAEHDYGRKLIRERVEQPRGSKRSSPLRATETAAPQSATTEAAGNRASASSSSVAGSGTCRPALSRVT